ncbi:cytochrome c-type biogenesis protein [Catenovulum sediminis]|uniref:Cytochrome c-type biogenesis protein n=1 Tax=Catenovulum sediminis TaxID=1740262 RepID=A0ABV1RL85_9ALTE|nr:cytochrome c-type biogenesis protein [Catenovulum sediminis]
MHRVFNIIFIFTLVAFPALAVEEDYPFEDPQQAKVFSQLVNELRCPKCQNQNIADSNAMVAIDLKNKTYQLVKEGQSKEQVVDFMVQRYGQFVHYDPPLNWLTIWLWLIPLSLIAALVLFVIKRGQREQKDETQVSVDKLAQAKALLQQIEEEGEKK